MEMLSNLELIQLFAALLSGDWGAILPWFGENWFAIFSSLLSIAAIAKYVVAVKLSKSFSSLVYIWRAAKMDSKYSKDELAEIGEEFVGLADLLEKQVKRGITAWRSK